MSSQRDNGSIMAGDVAKIHDLLFNAWCGHEKRAAVAALGVWQKSVALRAEAAKEVLVGIVEDATHFRRIVAVEVAVGLDRTVTAETVAVDGGVEINLVEVNIAAF